MNFKVLIIIGILLALIIVASIQSLIKEKINLKKRLLEFRGIGQHKAEVAVDIFENFLKKDNFTIKTANNCESLLLTFHKEIEILNSLKEQ